jgi:hypothetical protein
MERLGSQTQVPFVGRATPSYMKANGFRPCMYRVSSSSMATPAEAFPTRCQAMLPPCDSTVGREPMLHEQQAAFRAKDAAHFAKRRDDLRDRTQRPRRHHRVENIAIEWNDFGRCLHQFCSGRRLPTGSSQQPGRRIDAMNAHHVSAIERQVQAGPDPDLQHATAGLRHDPPPVSHEAAVRHRKMGEAWQDMIAIQRHDASLRCRPMRYVGVFPPIAETAAQHRCEMKPLISSGDAKITSARSPIIPAPTSAGAPSCGPSSLKSVLNRKLRSQKSRIFPSAVETL